MNKVLFICGLIPDDCQIESNMINFMNAAANAFQRLFIEGLEANNVKPVILSAPFIGAYPIGYKKVVFRSKDYSDGVKYVSFFNLWGIRNLSRYWHLKKEVRKYDLSELRKVIVYSVHTPFANIAKYIKRKNPNCEICLIVPDLPEYMNLRKKKSWLYRFAKKFDSRAFYRRVKYFDCFSLVSKHQTNKVNLYKKKEVVIESIAKDVATEYCPTNNVNKKIVYTGSLNEQFGVLNLLSAVLNSRMNAQLIFCGSGDSVAEIKAVAQRDSRIVYQGVVSHAEAVEIQRQADILVNPRLNVGDYTKFSFPSKTLEYLSTGRPVVCYKLDGIPEEYDEHLIYPPNTSIQALTETLQEVLTYDEEKRREVFYSNTQFLLENKGVTNSLKKLLEMFS